MTMLAVMRNAQPETNAQRAARCAPQAEAAATALTWEWLHAMQALAALASAVAACTSAHPGQRDLARRQAITLSAEAQAAEALLHRHAGNV